MYYENNYSWRKLIAENQNLILNKTDSRQKYKDFM